MFSFKIFVGSRRELVANSIHTADADATQLVTGAENWKLGHDWPPTRRNSTSFSRCRQIVQTRRDCRQLVANSIHTADASVGGVYWALEIILLTFIITVMCTKRISIQRCFSIVCLSYKLSSSAECQQMKSKQTNSQNIVFCSTNCVSQSCYVRLSKVWLVMFNNFASISFTFAVYCFTITTTSRQIIQKCAEPEMLVRHNSTFSAFSHRAHNMMCLHK